MLPEQLAVVELRLGTPGGELSGTAGQVVVVQSPLGTTSPPGYPQ